MIKLPKYISSFNANLFADLDRVSNFQMLIDNWADRLTKIPEVKEVIISFWSDRDCVFSIASSRSETIGDAQSEILASWKDSGLHDYVLHDLKNRNVSLSFSNYTWIFPATTNIHTVKGIDLNFPRPYAIMIPFSSFSQFTLSSEEDFYGYAALFFDEFPQMNDELVQPVISLPEVFSAALCAFFRNKASHK